MAYRVKQVYKVERKYTLRHIHTYHTAEQTWKPLISTSKLHKVSPKVCEQHVRLFSCMRITLSCRHTPANFRNILQHANLSLQSSAGSSLYAAIFDLELILLRRPFLLSILSYYNPCNNLQSYNLILSRMNESAFNRCTSYTIIRIIRTIIYNYTYNIYNYKYNYTCIS